MGNAVWTPPKQIPVAGAMVLRTRNGHLYAAAPRNGQTRSYVTYANHPILRKSGLALKNGEAIQVLTFRGGHGLTLQVLQGQLIIAGKPVRSVCGVAEVLYALGVRPRKKELDTQSFSGTFLIRKVKDNYLRG